MVCKGTVRRSVIAMKRDFRKLPANELPRGRGGGKSWKAWGGGGNQVNFMVKQPDSPTPPPGG